VAFSTGLRCFVGHVALATLPSRALSDEKIPSPKTRTYSCDVPKKKVSVQALFSKTCIETMKKRSLQSAGITKTRLPE